MGAWLVLGAAALWSLIGPVSRVALEAGMAPAEIGLWRAVFGASCFAAHARVTRRVRLERGDRLGVAAFGVLGVAGFFTAYFQAVRHGGVALASVLLYTAPAFVAMASAAWFGERITRRKGLAIALSVAGVAGVALAGGGGTVHIGTAAVLWGLAAGLTYASYYVIGKLYFGRYAPATVFLYALPVGAVVLLAIAGPAAPPTPQAWMAVAFLGVVPTYGAFLLYGAAVRRMEAARAATLASAEPVITAVLAWMLFGERLSVAGYAFAGLVMGAVVLMATAPADERTRAAP